MKLLHPKDLSLCGESLCESKKDGREYYKERVYGLMLKRKMVW